MIDSGKFKIFYGVDLYSDHHNTNEYKHALKFVGLENNYRLLRMSFDDALGLFDDDYFNFIYFDGYAHTGEEGGKTFVDWFRKAKIGGVIAGDDYHDDWPLVKWAVNTFAKALDVELSVTGKTKRPICRIIRRGSSPRRANADLSGLLDEKLFAIGQEEKEKRATKKTPQMGGDITLSTEQISDLLRLVVSEISRKIPDLLNIVHY